MIKRSISLGAFFSAILLFFLVIILTEGGLTTFFRIKSQLQEFTRHGETFMNVGSLLLRTQVERGEEFIREAVRDEIPHGMKNNVLAVVILDGDRIVKSLKGWLPEGMVLPPELLNTYWEMNDLLDIYGRNLLTGIITVDGHKIFAAMELNLGELDAAGSKRILPILSTSSGRVVWMGRAKEESGLASHIRIRGLVARKNAPDREWTLYLSHYGERVILKQEPFLYGLRLTLVYPLRDLLFSALSGAAFSGTASLSGLLAIIFLWFVWKRGIYKGIAEITSLTDEMSSRLTDIGGNDHLKTAETLNSLAQRFANLKETFVQEMDVFTGNLRSLFQVISLQQEELTAFNEETEAMNQELALANNRLLMRETLWERTLDFSRTFARSKDSRKAISSTLNTIRKDIGAFGVLISSVEKEVYHLTAFSGYGDELDEFTIPRKGIAATESIQTGVPLWVEDVSRHPTAYPVHPAVKSELLVPLFQAGEEEGVLEIAFDRPMKRDPFLVETLVPVASYLGGLVHGEKMRREVEASYSYLAEKLQFVTGIYHDETEGHIARIGTYCRLLARELGRSPEEQENIALFARLHDIGKLKVPHYILSKPGKLSSEEFFFIIRHPEWGAEILGDASWLVMARNICLTHHEKWDGSGYPHGLKEEDIPWEGRVTTVADIYDALRSCRAYKPSFSHEKAMEIITKGDGRVQPEHFDPAVLNIFVRLADDFAEIFESQSDE